MSLCDRLEAEQVDAESAHAKLVETLLSTLIKSTDAAELAGNWKRLSEHFETLFTTESSLDALKQTIVQLAVMGKLVPQDPNDEPASELLKRVRGERTGLGASTRGAEATSLAVNAERTFESPKGWKWARLIQLADTGPSNGLSPKPCSQATPFRCLTLSATTRGFFKPDCFKYVDITEEIAKRYFLKKGDLLIQRGNSIEYVGIAAIYDQADDQFIYPDLMMRIQLTKHCDARFLHTWLISTFARNYFMENATGTQGTMPKVNQGTVSNTPIPIPPLAEQYRIVAKVDELISLCDHVKADLAESRTRQTRLSAALIETALQAA